MDEKQIKAAAREFLNSVDHLTPEELNNYVKHLRNVVAEAKERLRAIDDEKERRRNSL